MERIACVGAAHNSLVRKQEKIKSREQDMKTEGEGGEGRAVASWNGPPGRGGPSKEQLGPDPYLGILDVKKLHTRFPENCTCNGHVMIS